MSDERPTDPWGEPAPARDQREHAPARAYEPHEPRPRRSARHAQARAAKAERPARVPRASRGAVRTSGGLPVGTSAVRRRLLVAFTMLAIIVAVMGYGAWSALYKASADVPAGKSVEITVPEGASGGDVATLLAEAGVVDNPLMFRWRASLLGATNKLKAGTYTLTTGSDYDHVIAVLSHGPEVVLTTVTIPEGFDIQHTAERVQEKLGIPAQEFATIAKDGVKRFEADFGFLADDPTPTLEGYLFPKTYSFKPGVNATDVITAMLQQYARESATVDYAYAKSKNLTSHDVLTIASIIEREAAKDTDRPKVASVIYNRLRIGMRLQADPTVSYALGGKVELTLQDLQVDNPYNTYVHAGLPPGPICSPGLSAIEAAVHPETTKYLYYILVKQDGPLSFATNYEKFLQLKAQYKAGSK
jgi:UPF0755 protein